MNAVMSLKKNLVIVGPDRCWKSTLCQWMSMLLRAPIHAGKRGSERSTGIELFHGEPKVHDRGIVCARAYDVLLQRTARSEKDYLYAETMMQRSGSLYVFMDRDDFTNVKDDVNTDFDLQRLSEIYKQLLASSCVPYERFVVKDDTGADIKKWILLLGDVIAFASSNNAIDEGN